MVLPSNDGEWVADQRLVIRLGTLEEELRRALAEHQAANTLPNRRAAIRHSLSAIVDFVRSLHPKHDPTLVAPLVEVVAALLGLERGERPDIFTPMPISHRPPDALPREHSKAYVAATYDRLLATGMSRNDAARSVTRILRKHGYRLSGRRGTPTAKTVIQWRNNYIGSSGDGIGPRAFRELRPTLDQMSMENALAALDRFLATIRDNPPS